MNFPNDLRYTKGDEWVRLEGSTATVGITDYAQEQLSDIVFVELPSTGQTFKKGEALASVESVKAASEVYLPVGGTVTEVNEALSDTPELVNQDPYGGAWMVKLTVADPAEAGDLMDAAAYEAYCKERES
jgi:glycine cleavage system H protein